MEVFQLTRRFSFDSGHRIFGYDGACGRVHGHHYVLELTFQGRCLNDLGMLVDFVQVKELVKPILDEWDHKLLLAEGDPVAVQEAGAGVVVLPMPPTAEVIAKLVWQRVTSVVETEHVVGVQLVCVRVYETPDCWVEYRSA